MDKLETEMERKHDARGRLEGETLLKLRMWKLRIVVSIANKLRNPERPWAQMNV